LLLLTWPRYLSGQHFLAHEDAFPTLLAAANGFQRHATLLVYLNDVAQVWWLCKPHPSARSKCNLLNASLCRLIVDITYVICSLWAWRQSAPPVLMTNPLGIGLIQGGSPAAVWVTACC
jgi:hypothetical protein